MKHIIRSILVIIISIFMLASCSMNINHDHETVKNNDVIQHYTDDEDTRPEMTKTPEDTEHNQGGSHMGDELYPLYMPIAGILSVTPGDDTSMVTKSAEVAAASDEYLKLYGENRSSLPPLVYYIIHELDLTREEVEYYYRDSIVSADYIDALFIDDVEIAKKLLKSPYAFQIEENIYNIYEIQQIAAEKSISRELQAYMSSDEFKEVIENINDYLDNADPLRNHYDTSVFSFIESSVE